MSAADKGGGQAHGILAIRIAVQGTDQLRRRGAGPAREIMGGMRLIAETRARGGIGDGHGFGIQRVQQGLQAAHAGVFLGAEANGLQEAALQGAQGDAELLRQIGDFS